MRESRYNTWAAVGGRRFVHNGMSGKLVGLSEERYADLQTFLSDGDPGTSEEFLTELVEARVITNDDVDELAALRGRYLGSATDSGSLAFTVITSLGCNFDCPYCYEDKHPSLLRPEVADTLVGLLVDAAPRLRRFGITWLGGEPLMAKQHLFDLSDHFIEVCESHDIEYRAGIITNGSLLDGETARQLALRHVDLVQVTIDGPPDVHDRYRPRVGGGATFWGIVDNLEEAVEHLSISLRVNVDAENLGRVEELFEILADRGLADHLGVGAARLSDSGANPLAPSASYGGGCYTSSEFARVELEVDQLARRYGFSTANLPQPIGNPCTAVRSNEVIVGSEGEMWKCWEDVGDDTKAIGHISAHEDTNDELTRWLTYDPFSDPDCSSCIALPGCMGGCAQHLFFGDDREARCGTFRFNHRQKVEIAARAAAGLDPVDLPLDFVTRSRGHVESVPVSITPRPLVTTG